MYIAKSAWWRAKSRTATSSFLLPSSLSPFPFILHTALSAERCFSILCVFRYNVVVKLKWSKRDACSFQRRKIVKKSLICVCKHEAIFSYFRDTRHMYRRQTWALILSHEKCNCSLFCETFLNNFFLLFQQLLFYFSLTCISHCLIMCWSFFPSYNAWTCIYAQTNQTFPNLKLWIAQKLIPFWRIFGLEISTKSFILEDS